MEKETIIGQVVEKAYIDLIDISKYKINLIGGYFEIILFRNDIKEIGQYIDEIMNNLVIKFCDTISKRITENDIINFKYKSYCCNQPSKELLDECLKFVNNNITNKKDSKGATLTNFFDSLLPKFTKNELENTIDTVFDILLNYYSITC